jgi:hypothetical protein
MKIAAVGKLIIVVLPFALIACAEPGAGRGSSGCCRVCTTGKPCGDSCINRSFTCHKVIRLLRFRRELMMVLRRLNQREEATMARSGSGGFSCEIG